MCLTNNTLNHALAFYPNHFPTLDSKTVGKDLLPMK
jgi:hypothetical protein